MDDFGDSDGDGFIDYAPHDELGLTNQGWKDSWDGVTFEDGSLPTAPIALIEVQGYAYAALHGAADIYDTVERRADAERCRRRADALRDRFDAAYWDERGFYVEALDGSGRRVDSLGSNPGHALWTGIASPDCAHRYLDALAGQDLWSGWGVRTLATSMGAYDPLSYHNGSVWPHDTAIAIAGAARYGRLGRRRSPHERTARHGDALRRPAPRALRRHLAPTSSGPRAVPRLLLAAGVGRWIGAPRTSRQPRSRRRRTPNRDHHRTRWISDTRLPVRWLGGRRRPTVDRHPQRRRDRSCRRLRHRGRPAPLPSNDVIGDSSRSGRPVDRVGRIHIVALLPLLSAVLTLTACGGRESALEEAPETAATTTVGRSTVARTLRRARPSAGTGALTVRATEAHWRGPRGSARRDRGRCRRASGGSDR
jgi:hypothetical protein